MKLELRVCIQYECLIPLKSQNIIIIACHIDQTVTHESFAAEIGKMVVFTRASPQYGLIKTLVHNKSNKLLLDAETV